jgi:hypothetical protein
MLQASKHQGHTSFKGSGRQCMANAAAAIYTAYDESPKTWTSSTLDEILLKGDELYTNIVQNCRDSVSKYLNVDDLPAHTFEVTESVNGTLCGETAFPFYSLQDAFEKMFSFPKDSHCIFTMGNTNPCYSSAVIKTDSLFYFFDPHSRSETGMQSPEGFATLTIHKHSNALSLFIKHLAASLNQKGVVPFELSRIVLVDLHANAQSDYSDSGSEFSGFEPLSEGEIACRLYIANENIENILSSDLSEISSINTDNDFSSCHDSDSFESILFSDPISRLNDSTSFINCLNPDMFDELSKDDIDLENDNPNENSKTGSVTVDSINNEESSDKVCFECRNTTAEDFTNNGKTLNFEQSHEDKNNSNENKDNAAYDEDTDSYEFSEEFLDSFDKENNQNYENQQLSSETDNSTESDTDFVPDSDSENENESLMPLSFFKKKFKRRETLKKKRSILKEKVFVQADTVGEIRQPTDTTDREVLNEENMEKRGRKRKRMEHKWKTTQSKRRRNHGKSYVNKHGRIKKARAMKNPCGQRCKFKCSEKFSENEREKIFQTYWGFGDVTKQRQFIIKHVSRKAKSRKKATISRRKNSYFWTLPHVKEMKSERVCKTTFLNTLNISEQVVATAHNKNVLGVPETEKRGKSIHSRFNKTEEYKLENVRNHIKSFKPVASHYCRKDTNKTYLNPELSAHQMYRLYKEDCSKKKAPFVSLYMYRNILNNEFNISFHTPKKDQCDLCSSFANSSAEDKEILKDEYQNHIQNKNLSFLNKDLDKSKSKTDPLLAVACFDLEQVLLTPKAFESCIYYKRQLNNYNFTIYDYSTSDGYSFLWNESIASRGGCEVASCVYHYIQLKALEGKKKFIFYSDNCVPQNKNRFFLSMLWYCLHNFNLTSIEHKYFEKGHTRNENDSMHASIEHASRKLSIYTTAQWATIIQSSRKGQPYIVKEMSPSDFFDFRDLSEKISNFEYADRNERVMWSLIRLLKLSSETPNAFSFKYNYGGQTKFVDLFSKTSRRTKLCSMTIDPKSYTLKQLRNDLIPISSDKYNDLVSLCINDIIPRAHHVFYALLPHGSD